jgi:hypothetical protein
VKKEILSKKLADHVIVGLALQGMPESAMLPAKTLGALFLESIYPQWRFCQHFKSIYDPFDICAPTFEGGRRDGIRGGQRLVSGSGIV